jgi:hypothetical protein
MSDSFILVQGTAQKLDTRTVTTGVGTVERQVGAIGDPVSGAAVARVGSGPAAEALRVVPASDHQAQTTGSSVHHKVSLAATNPTVIKALPGKVTGIWCYNNHNAIRKVAFHDTALAPTAGTTPIRFAVIVPANGSAFVPLPPEGVEFVNGIAYTMVTGVGDANANAVGASDLVLGVAYV